MYACVICADLTITTEKLMELFAPLDPKDVDKLGVRNYLGLPHSEIDKIQRSYENPTQRRSLPRPVHSSTPLSFLEGDC